jgi:hypothetical protein
VGLFENIKTLVAPPPDVEQGEDDPFFDVDTDEPQGEDGDDTAVGANG